MKRLLTTLVILTGLFGGTGAVWADAQSDFKKGMAAYGGNRLAEAVTWTRKAAEQGYADAQSFLGLLYYGGEGVTQDYAEAAKWFRKAAVQGDADTQFNLGYMYSNGEGVSQDTIAAHMWFNIAAANGANNGIAFYAGDERDIVEKMLSAGQLEKANERAKRCKDSDYKDCEAKAKSWWQKLTD